MTAVVDTGGAVWAVATRISPLDNGGNIIPNSSIYVTRNLLKATLTPVNEAGDAIAIKDASGALGVFAIKGDSPKWYTVVIDLVTPDPELEALLCGGTVYNDVTVALGLVTGTAVATEATGGTLTAGNYAYEVAQYNQYGASIPAAEVSVTTTGSTSKNIISGMVLAAGALGSIVYGRILGAIYKIGTLANIGSQATSAASGIGSVTSLTVTALTKPIPSGFTFQITGDTNTPKITFTTSAASQVGAVAVPVTTDASVTTTIAAAALVPVFVDDGSLTPSGMPNVTDMTAGPGNGVGYQSPAMGNIPNANGVAIEFFMENIKSGHQATDYPYWRIALPKAANFVIGARDVTNANFATTMTGNAFENPNFGTGPMGDWQFDSTKIIQRAICGAEIVPVPSRQPVSASF